MAKKKPTKKTKEFWVRAETSPGKWGEVELKGKALAKYTAKRTTKKGRAAIIEKEVKKLRRSQPPKRGIDWSKP